ncbi:hypothetical protein SAMCFNEI73_pC1140 (plasmid) [Sinorhizobium americanum]|uniref:Uncharacterized protein n=1 Tax=Sinorhizobium americanum TaxID=194963 RepID=A0A1L3LXS6_9HYPH|nr:hypothetical protein SAMCFNEI73_pC1140 [Sinorhizobium americanum]
MRPSGPLFAANRARFIATVWCNIAPVVNMKNGAEIFALH